MTKYRHFSAACSVGKCPLTVTAIETLDEIQSLFIRRAVVDWERDLRMVGTMCREVRQGGYPLEGLARRTPVDQQVRVALTTRSLAHAGYVLERLQTVPEGLELQVEHIYPQNPGPEWSSNGTDRWDQLPEDVQVSYRMAFNTIGNLTLLEAHLNMGAGNASFGRKAAEFYARSQVKETKELAAYSSWAPAAIEKRTHTLIDEFLGAWPRRETAVVELPSDLVPVVELEGKARYGLDWNQFEYVFYRGEEWDDVHHVKALFNRVFKSLWLSDRERFESLPSRRLISDEKVPRSQYDELPGGMFLFMGLSSKWLLVETQRLITDLGLENDVLVKLTDSIVAAGKSSEATRLPI